MSSWGPGITRQSCEAEKGQGSSGTTRPPPLLGKGEACLVERWQTGLSIPGMKPGLDMNVSLSVSSGGWEAWGPWPAQP